MKTELLTFLLKIARLRMAKPLVTFLFKHLDHFLLVDYLVENKHWAVFHHPQLDDPLHIVISHRRALVSPSAVSGNDAIELYTELFALFQPLISDLKNELYGCRLIKNGGLNQSIPQWHWHLVSQHPGDINA